MKSIILQLIRSWTQNDEKNNKESYLQILSWIENLNNNVNVEIKKIPFQNEFWYYNGDKGEICNKDNSFFQIVGLKKSINNTIIEQPIIIQNEIGYLGIICKEFNGVLHFLMQAKIEPGNINKIQISPTIQATKSNFRQQHGGKKPAYLDYFLNSNQYTVIVDQIQSEQSSRFYHKRNRNIILKVEKEIKVLPNYCWMTLYQLKQLMKIDNLVNMDTRTVLSCIPFSLQPFTSQELHEIEKLFHDKALYRSIFIGDENNHFPEIYQYINNYKMLNEFKNEFIPLESLQKWYFSKQGEFICKNAHPFKIIFCDISIEGREVKYWKQPLLEASGISTFGLIMCTLNHIRMFLIKAKPEIGSFDEIELGPSIQIEVGFENCQKDVVTNLFWDKIENKQGIIFDNLSSEEGGRFYHEQNRNILLEISYEEIKSLPYGYFWLDYRTLNYLVQVNNILNIQLRNLLSLLEA